MAARVTLVVEKGPLAGTRFRFEEEESRSFWIGRDPACHLRLDENDPEASRFHFVLAVESPQINVRDLGSREGTWRNGKRLTPARVPLPHWEGLLHGDHLRAGRTELRVEIDLAAAPPAGAACERCGMELPSPRDARCPSCPKIGESTGDARVDIHRLAIGADEAGPVWLSDFDVDWATPALGRGGFGEVRAAERKADRFPVAIKLLRAETTALHDRLTIAREIAVLASLEHPHIMKLYAYGAYRLSRDLNADRRKGECGLFLVMERCEGGSLLDMLRRAGRPLTLAEVAPLFHEVLSGLAEAHGRGIVHRDIKPSNILFTTLPHGKMRAKLADFGLAKPLDDTGRSSLTGWRTGMGTPSYAPWEQLAHARYVGETCDVWSAAATLFFALTFEYPRPGKDLLADPRPIRTLLPHLPEKVARVIDKALSRSPADRYPSARELGAELLAAFS